MKILMTVIVLLSLISCSSTNVRVKYVDKSPHGISILNVTKMERSKAYQTARSHCNKYNKVPKIRKVLKQAVKDEDEMHEDMNTMIFICIRP